MTRFPDAPKFLRVALLLGLAAPLGACGGSTLLSSNVNKGMQSVHQPVVTQSHFLYDVMARDSDPMSPAERVRLTGWLDSLDVGYGDHLAIASGDSYVAPAMRASIAEVLSHRGMMVEDDTSARAGRVPHGAVRLVLRRSSAAVTGCPNWRDTEENNMSGGMSTNYGCAANSNLAAMVADPEDLVRGQTSNSALRTATSNTAIKTYRDKAPTGAGGLQSLGGN